MACLACHCGAKGPRSEPKTLPPLFGQNQEPYESCARIAKKKNSDGDTRLA